MEGEDGREAWEGRGMREEAKQEGVTVGRRGEREGNEGRQNRGVGEDMEGVRRKGGEKEEGRKNKKGRSEKERHRSGNYLG